MTNYAIETNQLTKTFPVEGRSKPRTAVQAVSLAIPQGELFGLLGPNGAGKTTLTKMLCTLILPTSGRAMIAGYPLENEGAIRAAVGLAVADERSFYWRLTGEQNLRFFAALHGLFGRAAQARVEAVLGAVDLLPHAQQRFGTYSSGQKQRLAIGRALLHQPRLLFLDEPTRSLDPTATANLHELIRQLQAQQELTVFLITHDLAEAEKLCQRVAVMHHGRVQTVGDPALLRRQLAQQLHYVVRVGPITAVQLPPWPAHLPLLHATTPAEGDVLLAFQAGERDGQLAAVLDHLRHHQLPILAIEGTAPTLEEVFQHFTAA
ncbi:MAG: ABC transporter ATP-binding protein [Chloroflexi bacterium]|nr:ABC transporter ATP-binding protein [Chloroflexota bacterium]